MPTYLTPGVYVEEVPSGSMPLAAAATAVAAFVGYTAKAPLDKPDVDPLGESPRMVTSWAQYKNLYGGFTNDALLPQAVYGYFLNGGGRCYIVRIPDRSLKKAALALADKELGEGMLKVSEDGTEPQLIFQSLAASGVTTVELNTVPEPTEAEQKALDAAVEKLPDWKQTVRASADELAASIAAAAVSEQASTGVQSRSDLAASQAVKSGEDPEAAADAAKQRAETSASSIATKPATAAAASAAVKAAEKAVAKAKADAASTDEAQEQAETDAATAAFDAGGNEDAPGVAVTAATEAANAAAAAALKAGPRFDVVIKHRDTVERFPGLTVAEMDDVLNAESDLVQVISKVTDGAWLAVEENVEMTLAQSSELEVVKSDFDGDFEERKGVTGLAIAEDVTMVMVPDLITAASKGQAPGTYDKQLWMGVQQSLVAHCENERNRLAILDTPPNLNPQEARQWRDLANLDSKFAALYYPWLEVDNPAGSKALGNTSIHVPPCGHMAGIWARTDETRGVWKAPANEPVRGILSVTQTISRLEQELLNPVGINAIRGFGTQGVKVWGARTLSATDPSWKYINVRRLFNMVETTIMDGTQWVVFEPNDQALWERVKRTVNAFLVGLWREGALFGASPGEAFFVKCDAENNPPESRDEGKLIVEVGIAPVLPAEFVIFRVSQKAQTS